MSKILFDVIAGPRATKAELLAWREILDDEMIANRGVDYGFGCAAFTGNSLEAPLVCTRWAGHDMPHIAEGFQIYAVWEDDDADS